MYKDFPMLEAKNHINNTAHLSVSFKEYPKTSYDEIHWHNYYTIDIITEGCAIHNLNGNKYFLTEGDITLIKPTDIHSILPQNNFKTISILFTDSAFENKYRYLTKFPTATYKLSKQELALAVLYSNAIKNALFQLDTDTENFLISDEIKFNFSLILILIAKKLGKTATVPEDNVTKTLEYLNTHFREQLSQKHIAQFANLSPTYFCSWFKKNIGISYTEYIINLRLEYARTLLEKGFSVIESCYASGFNSLSHFNRTFKSKLLKNPSEYRKR